jgi:DNA-binding transcriptional ArsR family regulator
MPLSRRRVTEVSALKALAHPARLALLGALVTEGPLTASEAAALIGESPSNCSWHLRKLAEHGFVREARDVAGRDGRNRPWQAVSEGLEWGEEADTDAATRVAADALTDMLLEREMQRLRASRAVRDREPVEWQEATGLVSSQLWLTPEEAGRLKDDLTALLSTHAERLTDRGSRPEGARLLSLVGWVVPSGPTHAPEPVEQSPASQPAEQQAVASAPAPVPR